MVREDRQASRTGQTVMGEGETDGSHRSSLTPAGPGNVGEMVVWRHWDVTRDKLLNKEYKNEHSHTLTHTE